jgi:SNF2 family DNA or RNA helicase/predicted nucleotidyltransferase
VQTELVHLEELTPGARVRGVLPDRAVTVVQVEWHGTDAITLTYRDDEGRSDHELLYRESESRLAIEEKARRWSFDADGKLFRLVSEALRIRLAHLFDPYLAVHTSNIDPLPHQIRAVYGELLPRQPLRFLLADDPGAGKTIMAGLLIKELIVRGDLSRCMIVAPGSLVEQWQDELGQKLGLEFEIVTRDSIDASRTGNPFAEKSLVICRLDQLSRNTDLQAKLEQTDWDLVVIDEAHKCSAHFYGNEVERTKRYQLAEQLGRLARHFLLMTATPHSGKAEDFQLFMALLDPDRFEGKPRNGARQLDAQGLMRRMVKEELLTFDGKPLFPERRAYTVTYTLSDPEARLYEEVTAYVREEMNRAERLRREGEGRRGTIVGFALTILQRRLASSPEAIYQSLRRRRERLEKRLTDERLGRSSDTTELFDPRDFDDVDELPEGETERLEEAVVDQASAAQTIAELEAEIATLTALERLAADVRASGTDAKWTELSKLLQNPEAEMFDDQGRRRKLIVFSEHRDTLNSLADRIRSLVGKPETVVTIHGGMHREARREAQERFRQDPEVAVLVATDAAGEGVNLQRAHLLVNYDLPWNPNRIEQRFGRIHRIGQTEVCHMWNLVAAETREGQVFERLLRKLAEQSKALGGRVFDVLGDDIFEDTSLRELLLEAVRYGEQPEVKARLEEVVDAAVGVRLKETLHERALLSELMTATDVEEIRERMEEAEARKLQPHFVRSFFLEAFRLLGGQIARREVGRYAITRVPAEIRSRANVLGPGIPVVDRYDRVTFEKELIGPAGSGQAELLAPGHPLLDATVDLMLDRYRGLLRQGTVLIADADESEEPRALVYVEHEIQSARETRRNEREVVSRRLQFVELTEDWEPRIAGYAPYLDYRALEEGEAELAEKLIRSEWLDRGVEQAGLDYAIRLTVPEHLEEVQAQTTHRVALTKDAVRRRLTAEIAYWDNRANELKAQELAGRQPRMNSGRARQRADGLESRLQRRIAELDQEERLSALPPRVVGGALVIPRGLLERLRGERRDEPSAFARETERVERAAVESVLRAERAIGRQPREMPRNNPGFDIRSRDPITGELFFIEVKGRVAGAETVTVTKNEILYCLNKPEHVLLALVSVDGDETDVRYVERPYKGSEEAFFETASVNYEWKKLWERGAPPEPLERPPISHWIDLAVERIAAQFSPERIILFGSHARGEADGDSDIDLLVVVPELVNGREQMVEMLRALSDFPVPKDIVVTSPEEIERRGHLVGTVLRPALEEGRVLFERST